MTSFFPDEERQGVSLVSLSLVSFPPSPSMKIYVITEISSQVISLSLCRRYKHCQLLTRGWYREAEDSTCHLPFGKWRAWRSARSTQAALVPWSTFLIPVGGSCPQAAILTAQFLSDSFPLTELLPLIYHLIHLTPCRLSVPSFCTSPHLYPLVSDKRVSFLLVMSSLALVFFFSHFLKKYHWNVFNL